MKKFNVFKRKLHILIERIKLSESDYLTMKANAQMYKDMMSTVECNLDVEYEDVMVGKSLITKIPKSKTMTINIDIKQMLANAGITFDDTVKLNIK